MLKASQSVLSIKLPTVLILIATPWFILLLISFITRHSIFNSVPVWSDELSYWHEVLSLSQKGLGHGYYTYNESLPAASTFGSHGFGTVSVYAFYAIIFGWKSYSIVTANAFFMSLAWLAVLLIAKPSSKLIIRLLIVNLFFVPFLFFSGTSMSEGLNYAVLIVVFGLLNRLIKNNSRPLLFGYVLYVIFISLIRINYVVFFVPILFLPFDFVAGLKRKLILFLSIVLFSAALFLFTAHFVSPYNQSFISELFSQQGIFPKLTHFSQHFVQNILIYLNPFSDNMIQVALRYFTVLLILYIAFKSQMFHNRFKKLEIGYFVVFLILILTVLINISVYDIGDWRDYRVISPILFGSILFIILGDKTHEFHLISVLNLIMIAVMVASPKVFGSFHESRYTLIKNDSLLNTIKFENNAQTPFENTIIVDVFDTSVVMNVPAGIGISFVDSLNDNLKSKYIFSSKELRLTNYKLTAKNRQGFLYSNQLTSHQ